MTDTSNLITFIIEPLQKYLGRRLDTFHYHDVLNIDGLTTNKMGVDIISHQLEMKFENSRPIFISWAAIEGWFEYSLQVSDTSLNRGTEVYTKHDQLWKEVVGRHLKDFEVFGFKEYTVTSTEVANGKVTYETYRYEPHLIKLCFDNDKILSIANFYLEDDFIPKYPMGDDIWIIFGQHYTDDYIKRLSLDNLNFK